MSKPITRAEFNALKAVAYSVLGMVIKHDPDHAKQLRDLERRVGILERQMERLGAPQYRVIGKGKLPASRRTR